MGPVVQTPDALGEYVTGDVAVERVVFGHASFHVSQAGSGRRAQGMEAAEAVRLARVKALGRCFCQRGFDGDAAGVTGIGRYKQVVVFSGF